MPPHTKNLHPGATTPLPHRRFGSPVRHLSPGGAHHRRHLFVVTCLFASIHSTPRGTHLPLPATAVTLPRCTVLLLDGLILQHACQSVPTDATLLPPHPGHFPWTFSSGMQVRSRLRHAWGGGFTPTPSPSTATFAYNVHAFPPIHSSAFTLRTAHCRAFLALPPH